MGRLQKGVNDLESWCLDNGSFGKQLISEWTGECEDGNHYKIDEVTKASGKRFKWKCSKGHEWFARVSDRTVTGSGCRQCGVDRIVKSKILRGSGLKTWCLSNGLYGQNVMSEWTGLCEDGQQYVIDQVARASSKKFQWKCSKGHKWFAKVNDRTSHKTVCLYCLRDKLQKGINGLETWCLNNAWFGEQLISEWTGECEDGKHYNIDEVARASGKMFKWQCSKGHKWYTTVASRTAQKSGCPYCCVKGTSYPEQFIYHSLKQIFQNTENRCKVLKSQQNTQGIEFDIGIPDIPLCIEYSPTYWHKGKEERDQYKKDLCQKANVRLIQIVEDSYDEMPFKMEADYICFKMDENKKDEILEVIVDYILKSLGHSISEIDIERVKQEAYESSKGIEKEIQDTD